MSEFVSQRRFAKMAGVPSGTNIARDREILGDAVRKKDGKIDVEHPLALKYIEDHIAEGCYADLKNVEPTPSGGIAAKQRVKLVQAPALRRDPMSLIPEDIRKLADKSLRELAMQFGSDVRFCDWLKGCREIEMVAEKRLKNAKLEGTLVSRDLVYRGVIDILDAAFRQILSDGPPTLTRRLYAKAKGGRPPEDGEQFVREQLETYIRTAKERMIRGLRDAEDYS